MEIKLNSLEHGEMLGQRLANFQLQNVRFTLTKKVNTAIECRLFLRPGSPVVSEESFMQHLLQMNELAGKARATQFRLYKGKRYFCFIPDRKLLASIQTQIWLF